MELESARVFVKVVELGSFSRAADHLRLPKSTVSRTISRLESETGTKLLVRTTRSLKTTAAGLAFYETCAGPVKQIEDARRSLQGSDSIISGTIKVTAPEDLGVHVISGVMGRLSAEYPELSFDFNYTDEVVDLVQGGYDLAVRLGSLRSSRMKVRKLGEVRLVLVAAPDYLLKAGKLREPRDLEGCDCLTYKSASFGSRWLLRSKKGAAVTVAIAVKATGNQMTSLMQLAMQGAGVALIPYYLCEPLLKSGELVQVLSDWHGPVYPVSMISPLGFSSSARVKVVSDRLYQGIRDALSGV